MGLNHFDGGCKKPDVMDGTMLESRVQGKQTKTNIWGT